MMSIVRRLLLVIALMFWQGGFMFYGAVVVPVGTQVLDSHLTQGFITREVTHFLNLAGLVALGLWAWELAYLKIQRQWKFWIIWLIVFLLLVMLFWLHAAMDKYLDATAFEIRNKAQFRTLHSWYLILSTVQWTISLLLLAGTLRAWRSPQTVLKVNSTENCKRITSTTQIR